MSIELRAIEAETFQNVEELMGLPVFDVNMCAEDMDKMATNAMEASNFLKAISHEGRLMILCPIF